MAQLVRGVVARSKGAPVEVTTVLVPDPGPGATDLEPGDFVVLAWRAPCGRCRSCRRGRPWYCFDSRNASQKMSLEDGTELSPAVGIGALAELCLVDAGQAVKVDPA